MLVSVLPPIAETHGDAARVLLFTGHMVDAPDRAPDKQRFPRTATAEQTARLLIEEAIRADTTDQPGAVVGIASGASGGDILFHETCERLGIPTALFLALPEDLFLKASVQSAGPDWVDRFQALCNRVGPRVLQPEDRFPEWLVDESNDSVWQRCNCLMLFSALAASGRQTMIALYNPDLESDGAGGTGDFVQLAKKQGVNVVELDARALLTG